MTLLAKNAPLTLYDSLRAGLTFTQRLAIQLFQTIWDSQKNFEFVNS